MGDRAPMQGDITHLHVQPGAEVEKGDPLLALESMKMEVRLNHVIKLKMLLTKFQNFPHPTFVKEMPVFRIFQEILQRRFCTLV